MSVKCMNGRRSSKKNGTDSMKFLPVKMYDMNEIATELDVSLKYIRAIKNAGAPFIFGQTSPRWILRWMHEHATDEGSQGPSET